MKVPVETARVIWILLAAAAVTAGDAQAQINANGSCASEGLVMAGVYTAGNALAAGLNGKILESGDAVRNWPFRLECVNGKLRLTSGEAQGTTEVTRAVIWVRWEHDVFMVAFRGTDLLRETAPKEIGVPEELVVFRVIPGALPTDTPVVSYASIDGNDVFLMVGVLATTAPAYKAYTPARR